MTRHLRGAWARRRVLLPLLLLTAVVVAGAVATLGLAREEGTSRLLVVPLLVIGAVAVPASARELAGARRGEIALARLRGVEAGALQTLLLVEPLSAVLVGGGLGVALGALAGPVRVDAVLAAAGVVAVALVAVLVAAAGALREPLSQQVSPVARPRRSSVRATFGGVLVLVAAVVAVYRARQPHGDGPDWVVLAGPALVGLAAGQLVVWLVRLLARLAVRRTGSRSLPGFLPGYLAARRLARLPDTADAVRVLVGAAVVAALALTGAVQVDDWADDAARLRAGAALQVPLDGEDAPGALRLTRALDPDGRWLMAAVVVPGPGGPAARRAFLDLQRYDAVAGGFLDGTPAAALAARAAEMTGDTPEPATGDRVVATVAGVSARRAGALRPVIEVGYRTVPGLEDLSVRLAGDVGLDGAPVAIAADLPGCFEGCELTGLTLHGSGGPWVLSGLDFGGADPLAGDWRPDDDGPVLVGNGLLVPAGESVRARPLVASGPVPVLSTGSVPVDDRATIASPGGDQRPAAVLDVLPALPLVGSDGLVADLPTTAVGAPPTVPAAEVIVLARADTPEDLLAALAAAGGGQPRSLADAADAADDLRDETGAAQARVYALMAGCCLLVALLVLVTSVARRRDDWRRDAAALRVSGLDPRAVRRSGLLEAGVLAGAAGVAVPIGAVLAVRLLLDELSLVTVPAHVLPPETGPVAVPLLLVTALALGVTLLVGGRGRTVGASSRPAILREEAR